MHLKSSDSRVGYTQGQNFTDNFFQGCEPVPEFNQIEQSMRKIFLAHTGLSIDFVEDKFVVSFVDTIGGLDNAEICALEEMNLAVCDVFVRTIPPGLLQTRVLMIRIHQDMFCAECDKIVASSERAENTSEVFHRTCLEGMAD